jgi:hypothetical protein
MVSNHYLELDPTKDEFRLFTLKPGAAGCIIEGILEHCPLQTSPSYHGLSYVWGDAKDTQTILVDGHSLSVTSNLHDALQHIRDTNQSITLWIDAICINQSDKNELSQQVQMMKAIFSKADSVVAWIGPSAKHSGAAIEFISRFTNPSVDVNMLLEHAESEGAQLQSSVHDIFRRNYWGRVWILQELASARTVQVQCGHYSATLEAFQYFITTLSSRLGTVANYMSVTRACRLLKLVRLYREQRTSRQRLIDILWSTVEFQATDQRDKVYAILGIASGQDQNALPPDYTPATTPEILLRNIVKHHLEKEKDLDIFCYFPPLPTGPSNDCSWLPDLGQHINGLCAASFKASSSRRLDFRFSTDLKYLTVKGIALSTVETIIGPFEFGQFLDLSMKKDQFALFENRAFISLKNAALQALHTSVLPSATEDFVEDYFWNNIVGDNIVLGEDGPEVPCPCGYLELWESVLLRSCDGLTLTGGTQQEMQTQKTDNEIAERLGRVAKRFEKAVNLASLMRLSGRCIFITTDRRVGLGPANLQRGDTITIMFGSGLPLVLRQSSKNYRFVGPAYVHGAMHGEIVDGREADSMQVQEFTLS